VNDVQKNLRSMVPVMPTGLACFAVPDIRKGKPMNGFFDEILDRIVAEQDELLAAEEGVAARADRREPENRMSAQPAATDAADRQEEVDPMLRAESHGTS
jgi:predicted transcriptional regulator